MCINLFSERMGLRIIKRNQRSSYAERTKCKVACRRIRFVHDSSMDLHRVVTLTQHWIQGLQALYFLAAGKLQQATTPLPLRRPAATIKCVTAPGPSRFIMEAAGPLYWNGGMWVSGSIGAQAGDRGGGGGLPRRNTVDSSLWPSHGRSRPQPSSQLGPSRESSRAEDRPENPGLHRQQVRPNRFPGLLVFPHPPCSQLPSQVTS